ncbi:MAG: beta-ketoacyl-ACP synthase III [Candidatus Brocadiia bacterium]
MNKIRKVGIIGTGSFVPSKVLTNEYFESIVDTSDEWIVTRSGIKERRMIDEKMATSDMCFEAAKKALEAAKIKAEELDVIVIGTVTPDHPFPSTACYLQSRLGAKNAAAFDISAACCGFMYSFGVGTRLMLGSNYKYALVIGAESLTRITDYKDRGTCVLFGDGAGAVVLHSGDTVHGHEIIYTYMGADGNGTHLLYQPAGGSRNPPSHKTVDERGHCVKLKGREVYKFAVTKMSDLIRKAVQECGLTMDDIKLIVPHQVNLRILEAAAERLNFPMERVFVNIHKYGNTSSASVPIAFDEVTRADKLQKGDIAVLVAFGGGLTWASAVIRW